MSSSSRPKKYKPKGTVVELNLVQTVSRRGRNVIKTEEITTPKQGSKNASTASTHNQSSSPRKRPKFEGTEEEPIPFYLEEEDVAKKRQTLVFLCSILSFNLLKLLKGPKQLFEAILSPWDVIFGSPPQPRNGSHSLLLQFMQPTRSHVSMFGLLWPTLIVQGLSHQISCSASLSSTSAVEGRILWKGFIMRFGLCVQSWTFWFWTSMPRKR